MPVCRWKNFRISFCCLAIAYLCFYAVVEGETSFECRTVFDDCFPVRYTSPIDTIRAVVLYVTDTPPEWWQRVWDPTVQLSVPRFYKDNSFGKYILNASTYAFSGSGYDTCHGSAWYTSICQLDDSINFAHFDNDGPNGIPADSDNCTSDTCMADGWPGDDDGTVDAFFWIRIIPPDQRSYGDLGWEQQLYTNDHSIGGRQIDIGGFGAGHLARCWVNSEEWGVFVPAHEWGHAFGLPDLYGEFDPVYGFPGWRGLGGFSIMAAGMTGLRPAPFDPWSRIRLGWTSPIEVTSPLFDESIPDFHTTGTVYKLAKNPQEYFLVTNHRGVRRQIDSAAYWEEKFKGYGLMMWHVDTLGCCFVGCGAPPRAYRNVDLELAHGMWDTLACDTVGPNPIGGLDSLDFGSAGYEVPCGYPELNFMSETCFWNDSAGKSVFDSSSNPNSNGYGIAFTPELNRVQDVPTNIAVRNIRSHAPFTTAQADLLINMENVKHGDVSGIWGPGTIDVIGDIRVLPGQSLTIAAGTTLRMQRNYDYEKAGVDTTKCEIIVESGGYLNVNGAYPTNDPVKFVSSRSEATAGTDDWRGITVKPGGSFSMINAIIRHAYAGVEVSSRYAPTILNVRIGRCKMYGIRAVNTDALWISGCRVDSINAGPGGYGIYVDSMYNGGNSAWLTNDTTWGCYKGVVIEGNAALVQNCLVQGSVGWLPSATGIVNKSQIGTDTMRIVGTKINGYFAHQHLENGLNGRVIVSACTLWSSTSPSRSPFIIRSTDSNTYLKLRRSQLLAWQNIGVFLLHNNGQVADLGTVSSPMDSGYNTISTASTSPYWSYVWDGDCNGCSSPIIEAEWNCWGAFNPLSSRFTNNIDRTPLDYSCMEAPPKIATEQEEEILPRVTELYQNYPNPFNPTTLIQFNLQKAEKVRLEIFNILGQKVRTLLSGEEFAAGPYRFLWDGKDDRGSPLSSGMYLYRLSTPSFLQTKKMALVK